MNSRTERSRSLLILFILLFVSFAAMGFSQKKVVFNFKSIVYGLVYPFQMAGVKSVNFVENFFTSLKENRRLREELAQTKALLKEYERTLYDFEELKAENDRLRRLIGIQSHFEYDTVIAEVVAKSPQNFFKTIVVNRGSSSGVQRWMPVIAYQDGQKCVVGKVIDVQKNSSRVLPLTDQSSYIGAMLKKSRHSGILVGQGSFSDNVLLKYIDRNAEIEYGDPVVTSGMGGVFPKGILVGYVQSVVKKQYGVFQEAVVKPTVDLSRLEEVYIIVKKVMEDYHQILEE